MGVSNSWKLEVAEMITHVVVWQQDLGLNLSGSQSQSHRNPVRWELPRDLLLVRTGGLCCRCLALNLPNARNQLQGRHGGVHGPPLKLGRLIRSS
jgi:hypothetical protein